VLGICNGFQLLVKLGLLPALGGDYFSRQVSLSINDSARFEDRWVRLKVHPESPCVFTRGIEEMELPVRHGEGKIVALDEEVLQALERDRLIALQYVHRQNGGPTQEYPHNPNGSPLAIAGLTDPSGRVLGLMPHPEAYNHATNHPAWTRNGSQPLGTTLLENGVAWLREQ
jgi:phosphoribosylformylglycinamidine synthase